MVSIFVKKKQNNFTKICNYSSIPFSPTNDTKESMFGQQNVSSPAAGINPDIQAPESSMCANHYATILFVFFFFFFFFF